MSERQATMLVARRELSERLRQRAFQVSAAITILVVAVIAVLAGVLGGDEPERYELGASGAQAVAIAEGARSAAPAFDAEVEVRRFPSPAAAREAVRDESVDGAVVGGALVAREDPPEELEQAVQAAARRLQAAQILRSEGVEAAEARRVLEPPGLRTESLEDDEEGDYGVAFVASILLYTQLLLFGMTVASGVVEEKSSRVVEVLLAAIPSRSLLTGKILGIGALALLQLFVTGVVGVALAAASGAIELDGAALAALGVSLVWFVFGFALWACLFAIAGVIVSRQEDLQSSSAPLTILLVVSYLLVFPVLEEPSSTLALVVSLVPLSSPIVMPALVVMGEAGAAEIAASLGLLAAGVVLLLVLGARIYEGGVLRMGRPLKFKEAWRLAR